MALYSRKPIDGRILVTGANGFIGSRLCKTLKERGHTVIGGVRRSADMSNLSDIGIPLQYGDVTRPELLPELLDNIDVIVHNAGLVKARTVERLFEVNTRGTVALAEEAIRTGRIQRLIFISSQAAAGPSYGEAKTENDTPAPITSYGRSKLEAERALAKYFERMNVQILRPSGVYGPGDTEVFDFFKTVARGVRPYIGNIQRAINMIYVDDLTSGIAGALEHELPTGEVYALAHPEEQTFSQLVDSISVALDRRGVGIRIPGWAFRIAGLFGQLARYVGGTPMLTREKAEEILAEWRIDVSKATEHFDFRPRILFPEGARLTARWYREQGWL